MNNFCTTPIKVNASKKEGGLSEIYQSMGVKMALGKRVKDKENEFDQITKMVQCLDFIRDVYSSTIQKQKFNIYGMEWDGVSNSPDFESVNLLLNFPNEKAKEDLDKNLKFLFKIEDDNKIPRTVFYDLGKKLGLAVGNKAWLQNVLTLSLFSFLIRVFCYEIKTDDWIKEIGSQDHTDSRYISSIHRETWDRILSDLTSIYTEEFCGLDFKKDGISACHHSSGLISVAGNHTELSETNVRKNKHWQIMKERGFKLYTN